MIKIEHIEVFNFEGAIRGMRNPLNSWDKSDSRYNEFIGYFEEHLKADREFIIGKNDLALMKKLYKAGSEHRKYLRQIFVSMDITAPLYWWKEMDQYKIGVTTDSCSTMHSIHKKEFTIDDFSCEHLTDSNLVQLRLFIKVLNHAREDYLKTKDKKYWWQMIQLLPLSYNQKRTTTINYENVVNIIKQRTGHRLDEWNTFIESLKKLPYIEEIMG